MTPLDPTRTPMDCEQWEALLADALDGALTEADSARFAAHSSQCAACTELLEQTRRGQQWLRLLPREPEVPAGLLANILDATSGNSAEQIETAGATASVLTPRIPSWRRVNVLASVRRLTDARMMMTAAMAFFSIALTLNLTGVHLGNMHLSDLRPTALRNNLEKQFIMASTPVVRYYENLRFVYEVETRLREFRRVNEESAPHHPEQSQPHKNPEGGSAHRNEKGSSRQEAPQQTQAPVPVQAGRIMEAVWSVPSPSNPARTGKKKESLRITEQKVDQAERSLA